MNCTRLHKKTSSAPCFIYHFTIIPLFKKTLFTNRRAKGGSESNSEEDEPVRTILEIQPKLSRFEQKPYLSLDKSKNRIILQDFSGKQKERFQRQYANSSCISAGDFGQPAATKPVSPCRVTARRKRKNCLR